MSQGLALYYRFNDDVQSVAREGLRLTLKIANWRSISFTVPSQTFVEAIMLLRGAGATLEQIEGRAAHDGEADVDGKVAYYLERFARGRFIEWVVRRDGTDLLVLRSLHAGFQLSDHPFPDSGAALSRFAYLHRTGDGIVLESPETPCQALVEAGSIDRILRPATAEGAQADLLASVLWRAGFLDPAGVEEPPARRVWEFHDRLFHDASRWNRSFAVLGATYRFKEDFPSPPAVKPAMPGHSIALPAVDEGALRQRSDSLDAIMGRRASVREYATEAITLDELGEFLFRVARTKRVLRHDLQELLERPYPAGGSINELEFYAAVRRCQGLEPALYHYDGVGHGLTMIEGTESHVSKITDDSATMMGQPDRPPDAVLIVSSRLPRMAWKYAGMAYRASLVHVGVVFQTMYLVATDMGLAGCANGSGNSRRFAEATGLDWFEETAVGEFAIGSDGRKRSAAANG